MDIMESAFDYKSVPHGYAHCFNQQCSRSEKCMRHLVAKHSTSLHPIIAIINPAGMPEDANLCSYFRAVRKIRVAWGIKHLLDNVPHKDAKMLKAQMISYFGKTLYYRIYRKERSLSAEDQKFIRQIFQRKGVPGEPAFESYSEEYNW